MASLFDVLETEYGQRNKYGERIKRWLAAHDAALATTVKEQCAKILESLKRCRAGAEILRGIFDGEDEAGWRQMSASELMLLRSAASTIRALPLPDADQWEKHIRLETRLEEATWWHGNKDACNCCRLGLECMGAKRIARLKAHLAQGS